MTNLIKKIVNKIKDSFMNFLFGNTKINHILIKEQVLEDIISFAKANHPNEFIAFLGGEIKDNHLLITHLLYQQYFPSTRSVFTRINLPMTSQAFGTVHSHPGPSNSPSKQDIMFFGKNGWVHLIINYPYSIESIAAYDFNGNRITYDTY